MTDRKPGVFRGAMQDCVNVPTVGDPYGTHRVYAQIECSGYDKPNDTWIPDGALMPLDAATERLVEAVRIATHRVRMKERYPHDNGIYLLADALAAFDAARKGSQ